MGCFGYMCRHCHTPINGRHYGGGEKCVLIHIRHGKELGRIEGHYDEYGRVVEDANLPDEQRYRGDGDGINSHKEICESEFRLKDSYIKLKNFRVYKKKVLGYFQYISEESVTELRKHNYSVWHTKYVGELTQKFLYDYKTQYEVYLKLKRMAKDKKYIAIRDDIDNSIKKIKYDMEFMFRSEMENKGYNSKMYDAFLELHMPQHRVYSGTVAYHSKCYNKAIKGGTFELTPSDFADNQSWGRIRKKYV